MTEEVFMALTLGDAITNGKSTFKVTAIKDQRDGDQARRQVELGTRSWAVSNSFPADDPRHCSHWKKAYPNAN